MRKPPIKKSASDEAGPLLTREGESTARFLRGPHEGKLLSSLPRRELTALLKRSYAHASDAELLLNEHLSREYGRPMTAATAKEAQREELDESMHAQEFGAQFVDDFVAVFREDDIDAAIADLPGVSLQDGQVV